MQPVNLNLLNKSKFNSNDTEKVNAIKKKDLILDFTNIYTHWLIFKYTSFFKKARLIFKWLVKIIIKDNITTSKKIFLPKYYIIKKL